MQVMKMRTNEVLITCPADSPYIKKMKIPWNEAKHQELVRETWEENYKGKLGLIHNRLSHKLFRYYFNVSDRPVHFWFWCRRHWFDHKRDCFTSYQAHVYSHYKQYYHNKKLKWIFIYHTPRLRWRKERKLHYPTANHSLCNKRL